jgi:DNA invertase Pin-like site-specific DNA recombinase
MNIGYARVSTDGQSKSTEAQIMQLQKAGCEMIYQENESGGKRERKELNKALEHIRRGDVLIVCKLDRLSRSLVDLLGILKKLEDTGAKFRSLGEAIETESPAGRMMMHMLGCFAEFEREIIRERVKKGLAHAKANGRIGGGRYKLSPDEQEEAKRLILKEHKSQGFVAKKYGVDRSTISRMMNEIRLKAELKGEIL